jgi:uncharacterized BrkB/YihY/UPF0761 family membrane protein
MMTQDDRKNDKRPAHRGRACAKMAVVAFGVIVVLALMIGLLNEQMLDELKHTLSLWIIVALVVIINLVSFLCFVVLYAAYRWVRRDLKPGRDDELDI